MSLRDANAALFINVPLYPFFIEVVAVIRNRLQIGISIFVTVEVVLVIKAKLCAIYFSCLGIIEAVIAKSGIASFL